MGKSKLWLCWCRLPAAHISTNKNGLRRANFLGKEKGLSKFYKQYVHRWYRICAAGLLVLQCVSCGAVEVDGSADITMETKYVALTFDDGPKKGTTDRLLDGLRSRGASATFFLVGEQVRLYPDLVRRMQAEGHQVGNHTWDHMRLENATEQVLVQEIEKTEMLLREILGGEDYWLRPPYGTVNPESVGKINVPMVKWSVDPRDWESRDREKIVQSVLEQVKPNSIILLHDIYPVSVDAALEVIDNLQDDGYWFVTVEELLAINGIEPQPGVMYRSGKGTAY